MEFQDLQDTADLAHLNMDQSELRGAMGAFEEMLTFFAAMQSAGQDQAAFSASIIGPGGAPPGEPAPNPAKAEVPLDLTVSARQVNAAFFRPDAPNPVAGPAPEQMLSKAGERDGPFIVIPNVL
jgi:aspartyl-tRNA(Asn)/glutamyl-tRNA(Gln) amidotransferase subunit C